jgi:hypothetical protein
LNIPQVVIDQMVQDEKIETLVQIAGDLYTYLFDAVLIQQTIFTYERIQWCHDKDDDAPIATAPPISCFQRCPVFMWLLILVGHIQMGVI